MEEKNKIFEDFPEVDCNYCERYYMNQCDGAKTRPKGSKRACNQFLASRGRNIPRDIKRLENSVVWLMMNVLMLNVLVLGLLLIVLGG